VSNTCPRTGFQATKAGLRAMERLCLEQAEACDLDLARDALKALAVDYRAAADAIRRGAQTA
jgi:hypothetical protein